MYRNALTLATLLMLSALTIAPPAKAQRTAVPTVPDASITDTRLAGGLTADKFAPDILDPLPWLLSGNFGVTSGFLGTLDNNPLEFRVNNLRAMRYSYAESDNFRSINVLGGSELNKIAVGVVGATIAGGGYDSNTGVDSPNYVTANFGTVGGGSGNTAGGATATIAGGQSNIANGLYATVGGGIQNTAGGATATVAGGYQNSASGIHAIVAGGQNNIASQFAATVAGGILNTAGGLHATVAGGRENTAAGQYSFAAGYHAKANHDGAFVWGDSNAADFLSTAANQFNIRASGGTRVFSNSAASTGVLLAPGGGSWSSASDRNLKTNFQNVDPLDVLDKLVSMPLTTWNYKANEDIRHMGVMAQDFYAAFGGLGIDDKHIDTVDADGVAFAAIQGLNRKLEAKEKRLQKVETENAAIKGENAELKARLEALEAAVQRLTAQPK